ncbi:hypothetical protein AOQ84DRAFT_220655 [Glonium stellatum]|uniref:Uncharacterized protein n=1 Tax=Glonium stellatum TaxID=574774 RepID=A0A8E2FCG3_9PEZI|nr:hypothetical protein AOQ84DRAFT_220655 [Glonium stellatum]
MFKSASQLRASPSPSRSPSPLSKLSSQVFRPSSPACPPQPAVITSNINQTIIPSSPSPSPSAYSDASTVPDHDTNNHLSSRSSSPSNVYKRRSLHEDEDSVGVDPWLVRVVLDLYDNQRFDWMMIAGPIHRMWGVETSSAAVLAILQRNGRIQRTVWWD